VLALEAPKSIQESDECQKMPSHGPSQTKLLGAAAEKLAPIQAPSGAYVKRTRLCGAKFAHYGRQNRPIKRNSRQREKYGD
jgi:hypothetical protein